VGNLFLKIMKKIYSLLFLVVSSISFGQVLSEDFNYADSAVLTGNGWVAHSGAGTNAVDVGASSGLTYTDYSGTTGVTGAVVGNAAVLDNTGEDINKAFTAPVTSGSLYYSFLVKVTAAEAAGGYFTHFGPGGTGTSGFVTKVFVKNSATTGKINFGASNTNTGVYSTTEYDLNTTYLIIVKYDVSTTGAISMWIKSTGVPATEAAAGTADVTTSGTGSASIGGVYLRQYNAAQNISVDGIRVYTSWFGATPCALSLSGESTSCDAVTFNLDTYTTTIPFTGGGTGSYTLTTTSGTISGDNPSTAATGNIIVNGVTEGTNFTLTVSGACGFTKIVSSPECKPVNTLPFAEPFNYTVGSSLGSTQTWSNANTGDDVSVVTGNLTYTGISSTGNSVTLGADGKECHTPFTATTSTEGGLYASFLIKVSDYANVTTDGNQDYFVVLTDGVAANFKARLFIKKNASQYQLGLTSGTSTTNYDPTLFNVGDTVLVVLGYDFTTLKAWFNPTLASFTSATTPNLTDIPTTAIATLGGLLLRQGGATTNPTIIVDELKIATSVAGLLTSNQVNAIAGLSVYPNPVKNGVFYINTDANAERTVSVFNILGKQVLNTTTSENAINVSSLTAGVYMVQITEEGKTATKKLVIE
jgi:hypothetical protein